jgi:hypothetical protein
MSGSSVESNTNHAENNKRVIAHLEKEVSKITEENATREMELVNEIEVASVALHAN